MKVYLVKYNDRDKQLKQKITNPVYYRCIYVCIRKNWFDLLYFTTYLASSYVNPVSENEVSFPEEIYKGGPRDVGKYL